MVLLWELVQNQWPLFDGREDDLLDSVFRLRASSNPIVSGMQARGVDARFSSRQTRSCRC